MNFDLTPITIKDGRTLALIDARGSRVVCHTGVLWITQDRDINDVVLLSGQSFMISRRGVTLVHACDDSELSVSAQFDAKHTECRGIGAGESGWLRVHFLRWFGRVNDLAGSPSR